VNASVVREVILDAQFRYRVRRLRILRVRLDVGRRVEITVQHSTRRGKDDSCFRIALLYRFHEIERAENVDRCIGNGIGHALSNIDLAGEVSYDIEPFVANQLREFFRVHADLVKARLTRDVVPLSGGKIIDHGHVESLGEKEVDHV
jgi:hypothetical protein